MEEPCTINSNRNALHVLLLTRGGGSPWSGRNPIRLNPELHPLKVLVSFLDFTYLTFPLVIAAAVSG